MKYKMLVLDLDATLLDDSGEIPKVNMDAIAKAHAMGVKVVLCSGRSNMSLKRFIDLLKIRQGGYAIAFNGGYIYKTDTKEVISEHLLDDEYAREIIQKCRTYDANIMMYCRERLWIDRCTQKIEDYATRSRLVPVFVDNLITATVEPVSKVLIMGKNRVLKTVEADFKESNWEDKVGIVFSANNLLEFSPYGIDKGTAVKELAEHIGISCDEIIAVGDNYNDEELIKVAGIGVAVKNAEQDIKAIADYVTENDNNNGAVAEVIQKYIL